MSSLAPKYNGEEAISPRGNASDPLKRRTKLNHKMPWHRDKDKSSSSSKVADDEESSAESPVGSPKGSAIRRLDTAEGKTIKRDRHKHQTSEVEVETAIKEKVIDLTPRRTDWVKNIAKENVELRALLTAEKDKNKQFQAEYSTLMAEYTSMKAQLKEALEQLEQYRKTYHSVDSLSDLTPFIPPTTPVIVVHDLEYRDDEETGKHLVIAGKPEALFRKLLDTTSEVDHEFMAVFLLMHRYFISPAELLQKLIQRFTEAQDSPEVQERILETMKFWLLVYGEGLWADKEFSEQALNFIKSLEPPMSHCKTLMLVQSLKSYVDEIGSKKEKEHTPTTLKLFNFSESSPFAGIVLKVNPGEFNLLQLDPLEVAKQMTLLEHQHFQAITPFELLQKNFTKPAKSPNFHMMVSKFNHWSTWATTEILKRESVQQRAEIIGHFIMVAQACRDLNNFQSAYAIIGGLNHSSLARLKMTWEKVKAKYLVKFRALTDLFNIEQNFKNYRDSLHASKPPVTPYIGLYPKFLVAIEDGNPDRIGENVNFQKLRMLYRQIQDLRGHQQHVYPFAIDSNIRAFLRSVNTWSEDELFAQSFKLEPRDSRSRARGGTIRL